MHRALHVGADLLGGGLRQTEEMACVIRTHGVEKPSLCQSLEGVLADRLEHEEPRLAVGLNLLADQARVHQAAHKINELGRHR